ncbi:killer cell lectin-like receptor subfamily B member 1B allele B [Anomaloglossus baeobatrachus]|uniref:killer cell lectin-like receptor subfamily B member 1B allele B n=1 Tax=Anomaloglossus baeobatrachus TaxID=238106 RepID=UPI003F4F529C
MIWTPSWKAVIIVSLLGSNIVFIRIIGALLYNVKLSNIEHHAIRKDLCPNSTNVTKGYDLELFVERSTIRKELCIKTTDTSGGCLLCPYHWRLHGDQCYYYSDITVRNWSQSRDDCKMMGADLLVIKNQKQQEFIQSSLRQQVEDTYWIGLHRDGDVWRWVDGGQYNSSLFEIKTQSLGHCVSMTRSGYYEGNCNSTNRWICVKKAVRI